MAETVRLGGGEALARTLLALSDAPVFGMGGFQLLPFYDAAGRLGLPHHLVNDERVGVFAADAWARVSGRVGLCDATLGPGATNLVTGLVESTNAGIPLVAIVGDAHRRFSGRNMTQEARQIEILRPAVKEVIRVEVVERIPELVRRAFRVATSGRGGPVVVDVPEDVAHGFARFPETAFLPDPAAATFPRVRCRPSGRDVERAAALLGAAERPVCLAGGGVHLSGAAPALQAFAERHHVPVAHTLGGKGAVGGPLDAGIFGRYSRIANDLVEEADLLLVAGCKLGEIATRRYALPPPRIPLVHLDILPEEFGRSREPTVALWGDVREGLADLDEALSGRPVPEPRRAFAAAIPERMAAWWRSVRDRVESSARPVHTARLMVEIGRALPADAILVADGGFAAHWAGLLVDARRAGRMFVADRGLASIGYGLPGAIGVRLAAGDRPVLAITGDAGLNMVLGDLETARRLGLPFTLVVVNNAASGYVKALQHVMYGRYESADLSETNYAAVATALGCRGRRVEDPAELATALRWALAGTEGPTVLDVVVTRDPADMLPSVDSRAVVVAEDDRIA